MKAKLIALAQFLTLAVATGLVIAMISAAMLLVVIEATR